MTDKQELQDYTKRLLGPTWRGVAVAKYELCRQEGLSHRESMNKVYEFVIATAEKIIDQIS